MKLSSKIYSGVIFCFLFAPIVVLLVFSFNESKSLSVLSGFSLNWYQELLRDRNTLESVKNTLLLAASATAIATVIGTTAAVAEDGPMGKRQYLCFDRGESAVSGGISPGGLPDRGRRPVQRD